MVPDVNWLAVLVAAVANMVLGFIWYGPLFGKMWQQLMGWTNMDPARKEEMKKSMGKSYLLAFIGSIVLAYVLSHFVTFATSYMNTSGFNAGVSTGFWAWLGFVAPLTLGSILWEGKSWKLWCLNNGYNLLQLMLIGGILAVWM